MCCVACSTVYSYSDCVCWLGMVSVHVMGCVCGVYACAGLCVCV